MSVIQICELFLNFADMKAAEIIQLMESMRDDAQRRILLRFFKTRKPTDYGYGDEFLGLKNPQTREIVKMAKGLPLEEVPELLTCRWHEVRLCGFLILVDKFEALTKNRIAGLESSIRARDGILQMYLQYADYANNWDLVDLSVTKILGRWLTLPTYLGCEESDGCRPDPDISFSYKTRVLDGLAMSDNLWRQRMSVVCTWMTSHEGDAWWAQHYCRMHLAHRHDLMHKAVGWMLREMGKGCGEEVLKEFLAEHIHEMSRTTLRYAIERLPDDERSYWMNL